MRLWGFLPIWTLIMATSAWADVHVGTIEGVPDYPWYYGCGPTAGGMIVGYWDARGYGNLIAGSNDWATNSTAIGDMIASPGHVRDYYNVYPGDRVATPQDPLHTDDCLADLMLCSRGSRQSGVSLDTKQATCLIAYFKLRGYSSATGACVSFGVAWNVLVANVDAGEPMELLLDHDGDGTADHFVTAIGYRFQGDPLSPTSREYCCLNEINDQPQWYPYVAVGGGAHWAVSSGI